mgnify:CR=1 FL=1
MVSLTQKIAIRKYKAEVLDGGYRLKLVSPLLWDHLGETKRFAGGHTAEFRANVQSLGVDAHHDQRVAAVEGRQRLGVGRACLRARRRSARSRRTERGGRWTRRSWRMRTGILRRPMKRP